MTPNGWTGGQYSILRAAFGVWLLAHFVRVLFADSSAPAVVPAAVGILCSVLFLLGVADRAAALVAAAAGFLLHAVWVPGIPLLLHCLTPAAPYGSLAARGRVDPSGGWRLPPLVHQAAWASLAAIYAAVIGRAFFTYELNGIVPGLLMLHAIALDPAWIPPPARLKTGGKERIYYDGHCGLCHRAVRFVLSEDRAVAFRFAPLQSEILMRDLTDEQRTNLPDSIVVLTDRGRLLTRSAAVIYIARGLGGLWRPLAAAAAILPGRLLDSAYDTIARMRHRLFRRPEESCPVLPKELRNRFDP